MIRFRFGSDRLQIKNLGNVGTRENVMASTDALRKSEMQKQLAKVLERDVRVGISAKDAVESFLDLPQSLTISVAVLPISAASNVEHCQLLIAA